MEAFYEFIWPKPKSELVMDFVEGFTYVKGGGVGYETPIRAVVRGKPIEITTWVIQQVLGLEGTQGLKSQKFSISFNHKYTKPFEVTAGDYSNDGHKIARLH